MDKKRVLTRREFTAAAAFTIVPRHVLGGPGFVAPSDKIALAAIGMGRQGKRRPAAAGLRLRKLG